MSAWPVSSCSSRARRRRSISCPSITPPQRIALDAAREIDGDGGALGEVLGEPQVGVREPRVATLPVVGEGNPDRAVARQQRHVQARGRRRNCRATSWTTSGSSSTASTRSLRPRASTRADLRLGAGSRRAAARSAARRRSPRSAGRPPPATRSRRRERGSARVAARRRAAAAVAARARPASAALISCSDSSCRDQAVADS